MDDMPVKTLANQDRSDASTQDSLPIFQGQIDFDAILLTRIEKADKRIGVISVEKCITGAREKMHAKWVKRHSE
jgi:hypothetical protein